MLLLRVGLLCSSPQDARVSLAPCALEPDHRMMSTLHHMLSVLSSSRPACSTLQPLSRAPTQARRAAPTFTTPRAAARAATPPPPSPHRPSCSATCATPPAATGCAPRQGRRQARRLAAAAATGPATRAWGQPAAGSRCRSRRWVRFWRRAMKGQQRRPQRWQQAAAAA